MKSVLERFLAYVRFDTQSDETTGRHPSTEKQLKLARFLAQELTLLGLEDVTLTEKGYVYASLPPTPGEEGAPAVGFIAHLDTSDAVSGGNVRPRVVEKWDGSPVELGSSGIVLEPDPHLAGHDLVVTDGTTLLGADDKSGIAVIMTALEEIVAENLPRGGIRIAFTPDEEIGQGADFFDVPLFGAKYAYTVDAGGENEIEYENFNAASAVVTFQGVAIHPGYAYGVMVNALKLAMEFDSLLPAAEVPERTRDREGFFHLTGCSGTPERAELRYIIRDHDAVRFEERKRKLLEIRDAIGRRCGAERVAVEIRDQYRNMAEVMKEHPFPVETVRAAMLEAGVEPVSPPIRGGTDGSRLCFMGLPCPNIGCGGHNAHSRSEYADVQGMEKAVRVLLGIVSRFARA